MRHTPPSRQRGVTLVIALIMLVLLMMSGVAAFNLSRNNTEATGNVQYRMETTAAATATIEDVISKTDFIANPAAALSGSGCGTTNTANTNCYDVTGDGVPDISVALTPAPCVKKAQAIKNAAFTDPSDACVVGTKQSLGVAGTSNDNSLCSDTLWEVTAVATDAVTSAKSTITSGVTVRVATDDAIDATHLCPP